MVIIPSIAKKRKTKKPKIAKVMNTPEKILNGTVTSS